MTKMANYQTTQERAMLWFCTRYPVEQETTLNNLQKNWKIVSQSAPFFTLFNLIKV